MPSKKISKAKQEETQPLHHHIGTLALGKAGFRQEHGPMTPTMGARHPRLEQMLDCSMAFRPMWSLN